MTPLTLKETIKATHGRPLAEPKPCSISGVCTDSRRVGRGDIFFAIKGGRFDGHDFVSQALADGALCAVISDVEAFANYPHRDRLVRVEDTVQALGRLAGYYRSLLPATVIAVTGSNGKTTTKSLITHILSASKRGRGAPGSFNNQIGVPLTLLSADSSDEFLVVEVGTNAPGEIAQLATLIRPDIAVITSVGLAHLEGLGSLQGVIAEKLSLLDYLKPGGMAVVNVDEPAVRSLLKGVHPFNLVSFGLSQEAMLQPVNLSRDGHCLHFKINDRLEVRMAVPGSHNACNAVAAYAVATRLGLADDVIADRLATFQLPDMRLQMQQFGNILVINDSYNANPASMRSALDVVDNMPVPGRRVAIVGDMRELGPGAQGLHEELGRTIASSNIDVLVSVGEYSEAMCSAARNAAGRRSLVVHAAGSTAELSHRMKSLLRPRDTVLLKGSRAMHLETLLSEIAAS